MIVEGWACASAVWCKVEVRATLEDIGRTRAATGTRSPERGRRGAITAQVYFHRLDIVATDPGRSRDPRIASPGWGRSATSRQSVAPHRHS